MGKENRGAMAAAANAAAKAVSRHKLIAEKKNPKTQTGSGI